jgi:predicted dehydrogenase
MKPLGLGIIGLHHQHPRSYHALWESLPEFRPIAVAEEDKPFLAAENEFFRLESYTDYRKLLEREDIDVVIIFLPHSRMPEAVADSAAAGKHVIVEKPCAADLAGAERIVETARRFPDRIISAPYVWRTHPVSERLYAEVKAGALGEIVAVEGRLNAGRAHRYIRDHAEWMLDPREGGGPMWNLGVHWIDYFLWLTGSKITEVGAAAARLSGGPARGIEDVNQAVLRFSTGAVGILDISYSLPDSFPGSRDIYVACRGTAGAASWAPAWKGVKDELMLVTERGAERSGQAGRIVIQSKNIPGYGGQMGWAWMKDFAEAVREGRAPLVNADDICAAVRVADAFYRSLASGSFEPVI